MPTPPICVSAIELKAAGAASLQNANHFRIDREHLSELSQAPNIPNTSIPSAYQKFSQNVQNLPSGRHLKNQFQNNPA